MTETSTIIEAIHFLLSKVGTASKIKIVKLIYLADKYHLIHYGRTLTNDTYFAMDYGPVGSTVKDVLGFNDFSLNKTELEYATELLEEKADNNFEARMPDKKLEYDMLSETDKEALNFVIQKFGKMKQWGLMEYTHRYSEWSNYEDLLKNKKAKRVQIDTTELLSTLQNDPIGMEKKHIEESKNILTGTYE